MIMRAFNGTRVGRGGFNRSDQISTAWWLVWACLLTPSSSVSTLWDTFIERETPCAADENSPPDLLTCSRGHHRPPNHCTAQVVLEASTTRAGPPVLRAPLPLPALTELHGNSVVRQWNLTDERQCESVGSRQCTDTPAWFLVIPFHAQVDGGVNYYHHHVDVLLPLFVGMKKAGYVAGGKSDLSIALIPVGVRLWLPVLVTVHADPMSSGKS